MLQKKGDPITRSKVIATGAAGRFGLNIWCLVTAAGAISQNGKNDQGYDREKYDDNQHLDRGKQEAAECDDRAKQGYYQQN